MKKFLIAGIIVFLLMFTTVYALNSNSSNNSNISENELTKCNQNCPYYNTVDCPYYDETTETHTYTNNQNMCHKQYNNDCYKNGYNRQGKCHRYN